MSSSSDPPVESDDNKTEDTKKSPPTDHKKVVTLPLPIDWTKIGEFGEETGLPIRFPRDVSTIDPSETDVIEVIGTAGQKITKIGSDFSSTCSPSLKNLIFRSHIIHKMEGLEGFEELELLELNDNAVQALESLEIPGRTLRVLDMSYNAIKNMKPVQLCPNLIELYLAQNKLKSMSGLKHLSKLKKLDLGANRLRVMEIEELSGLTDLEELWLGKNKIEKIEGLEKLTKLRRLDVQSNRLTTIDNLTTQSAVLEELYLANNGITNEGASIADGLALPFPSLNTLDLSRNKITSTRMFAHLTALEDLWLSGNEITVFLEVQPITALSNVLEVLYLEMNPVAKEFGYRKTLKEMIPSLKQIDADVIRMDEHGNGSEGAGRGPVLTLEQTMQKMQEMALEKAKKESKKNDEEQER